MMRDTGCGIRDKRYEMWDTGWEISDVVAKRRPRLGVAGCLMPDFFRISVLLYYRF